MSAQPLPNGVNGRPERDQRGRFVVGWRGGPGNPHAEKTTTLRATLFEVVTPERFRKAVDACLTKAEQGDRRCLEELANRMLGKPVPSDIAERLERIEAILATNGVV